MKKPIKITLEIPVWAIRLGGVALFAAGLAALVKYGGTIYLTIGGGR
ncbi:hypothetical protein SMD20_18940 [Nonomuraea sp. LP-02]|nr:hypothetical protein [Nonomuraea sp. LP-02]MED7926339.1 hypothetical protein [Nonomuraea sp. LP-02]